MRDVHLLLPRISVVIPTLNEHESLRRAIESTRAPGVEQIVVDGGSEDGTLQTARFLRAHKLLTGPPNHGARLDIGYRAATGDVILFLHADTRLDPGWHEGIAAALRRPHVLGGVFRLRFEGGRWRDRLLESALRLRGALARVPCSDQALFVRRRLLDQIGGVPKEPVFADLDLVRAIRDSGSLALRSEPAWVLPRRYELRAVARNAIALAAYAVDVDRERVARWAPRRRSG